MIDIKNITKSFGSLQVLKGIDLHIDKGEVVSKKTFKKAIGDLYKRHIITLEEGGMGIVLVEK